MASTIYTKWLNNSTVRRYAAGLKDVANGDWGDLIPQMPAEAALQRESGKINFVPDLVGYALRTLSYLYATGKPLRTMSTPAAQEWAKDALWGFMGGLDATMQAADKKARLYGECLIQLIYKTDISGKSGIFGVVLPRQNYEVALDPTDPMRITEVLQLVSTDGYSKVHYRWTDTTFEELHNGVPIILANGKTFDEHGFGCIPFVRVLNSLDIEEAEEPTPFGGKSLATNLASIGSGWREFLFTTKLQRGQPWANGELVSGTYAPDSILKFENGTNFGILGNAANLSGIQAALQLQLEVFSRTLGLPSRTFKLSSSETPSGVAILADKLDLIEDRQNREMVFSVVEKELHYKAALIFSSHSGQRVDGTLSGVTFRPWQGLIDVTATLNKIKTLVDMGLMSEVDALKELYGETEDEAQARLDRAKADKVVEPPAAPAPTPEQPLIVDEESPTTKEE